MGDAVGDVRGRGGKGREVKGDSGKGKAKEGKAKGGATVKENPVPVGRARRPTVVAHGGSPMKKAGGMRA